MLKDAGLPVTKEQIAMAKDLRGALVKAILKLVVLLFFGGP